MKEWMNEWMKEWNEWMNACMHEWMNDLHEMKWMNEWMNAWTDEMNEWTNEWMNEWMIALETTSLALESWYLLFCENNMPVEARCHHLVRGYFRFRKNSQDATLMMSSWQNPARRNTSGDWPVVTFGVEFGRMCFQYFPMAIAAIAGPNVSAWNFGGFHRGAAQKWYWCCWK